jgi:hypothetical protein
MAGSDRAFDLPPYERFQSIEIASRPGDKKFGFSSGAGGGYQFTALFPPRNGGTWMADVFISYKSERRPAAEHLAAVLERHGYSIWFDYELIKGRDFGLQISRQVRKAKALVVLWCTRSVESKLGGRSRATSPG